MQEEQKAYKFVTSEDTQTTYVYVNNQGKYEKKYVYLPSLFEQMNHKQIQSYKLKTNARFIAWSLFNRDKFKNNVDYRIVLSRFIDINTAALVSLSVTYMLKTFFFKLESPFLDFYFEDKLFKLPQLKRGLAYSAGAMILYGSIKSVLSLDYMFDLALEYKQYFASDLVSQNCEHLLPELKLRA